MEKQLGKLYTSNPNGLRYLKEDAEILQITRGGVNIPNTTLLKELSPSPSLFQNYVLDWKDRPFNEWWYLYEKRFLNELETEEKIRGLRDVYKKLLSGKNVVLVCFCKDHRYCHRKIVGDFFKPYGVEPIELNPIFQEQLSLF